MTRIRRFAGCLVRGRGRLQRWSRRFALTTAFITLVGSVLWWWFPFEPQSIDRFPAGMFLVDQDGQPLRYYASREGEMCFPVTWDDISPWLRKATVAVEDRRFDSHPGVDPAAVARALMQNLTRLEVHSGASTLTMQLVRILEGRPRTLVAKAIEAFRAFQVESRLTKDEILVAYLNLAPYGGNLRGVEAAARRYFGKGARDLTLAEAALMAGLPQSPSLLRPDRHYERALRRRRVVLDAMLNAGMIDDRSHHAAVASRPTVKLHPWPFRAPHFADLARRRTVTRGRVVTTLDADIQQMARERLQDVLRTELRQHKQLSGAVVVIEVATGAVRALVGAPEFFDQERSGQVNLALARRSSGSTLKPFLYGLAFDQGWAAPSTFLADVPTPYAGYVPENFDREFHGPVPAARALAWSLNIPAVRLLERAGVDRFLETLRDLGLRTLNRTRAHYGLTLALGGAEVRLLELANAYATLARLGVYRDALLIDGTEDNRPRQPAPERSGTPVISAGAARMVLSALATDEHLRRVTRDTPRPGEAPIAYKTGTSFGFRDAWTFAVTPQHVVGVWVGDPRGAPCAELQGVEAAAPIAVPLARSLSVMSPDAAVLTRRIDDWGGRDEIAEQPACRVSGFPASDLCPNTAARPFLMPARGRPRWPGRCSIHRRVLVDPRSGVTVCSACRRGRRVEFQTVVDWPTEVADWLRSRRRDGGHMRHDPSCPRRPAGGAPLRILAPVGGAEYRLLADPTLPQRLPLIAAASNDVQRLFWFVNGERVGAAPLSESVLWDLRPGQHEIRCVDDRGRATAVSIRVVE